MEARRPNKDDAKILLELLNVQSQEKRAEAFRWFFNEFLQKKITDYVEFKRLYPDGADEHRHIGEIMGWYELAGAFVEHDLLSEDLLFDVIPPPNWFWEALKPIVYGMRGQMKEARIGENFELLYERYMRWQRSHPPKVKLVMA